MGYVSVVIPCYRSARVLPALVARLEAVLPTVCERYEIVLVVDGSPDGTWDTDRQLALRVPAVRAMCLARNYGQHNALLCGIRHARFDTIVTMDDDLQNPPEEIVRLLAKLEEGFDPRHLGANEYLGELYAETGKLDLAKERLAVLEAACGKSCEEREDLAKAIAAAEKK